MTGKSVLYGIGLALAAALGYWVFYVSPEVLPVETVQPVQTDPTPAAQEQVALTQADSRLSGKSAVETAPPADPGWEAWSVEDFSAHAKADAAFAARLRYSIGLCSLINNKNNPRFSDPRWHAYVKQCVGWPWEELREIMYDEGWRVLEDELHPDIEAASKLPEGDPEARRLASGVLASSTDKINLQTAYSLYFDPAMIRAMAGTGMHVGLGLDREDQIAFQIDASMYIACQFAESGCGWNDPAVLVECATTNTCFPGMGMYQILALRNSPLRMELFQRVSEDVARLRRGP